MDKIISLQLELHSSSTHSTITMKAVFTSLLALATAATAIPQKRACSSAVSLSGSSNAFASYTLHPNSFYRAEVEAAANSISDSTLKAKALKVADFGSFLWL
jgi:cellulose 1,4-beta-cellobiosidase